MLARIITFACKTTRNIKYLILFTNHILYYLIRQQIRIHCFPSLYFPVPNFHFPNPHSFNSQLPLPQSLLIQLPTPTTLILIHSTPNSHFPNPHSFNSKLPLHKSSFIELPTSTSLVLIHSCSFSSPQNAED